MSTIFDRTLIDPGLEDLDALFPEAVKAANASYRIKTVEFPFPGLGDFLHRFLTTPEGIHGWHGGSKPNYYEGRSQVIVLWWSDRLKRKHVRVLGGDGGSLCYRINLGVSRHHRRNPLVLSPLEQIYPSAFARVRRGDGTPSLVAVCDCGAVGAPATLGWMGQRCGPCHDRVQEGAAPPPALTISAGGGHLPGASVCRDVAFSSDGRRLAFSLNGLGIYDLETGSVERPLPKEDDAVWDVVRFTADGGQLILFNDRGDEPSVTVWDQGKRKAERHPLPRTRFLRYAISPDGETLAAGHNGVEVRAARSGTVRQTVKVKEVSGMAFSPDGKRLAVAAYKQPLRLFNAVAGKLLHEYPDDHHPTFLAFSPDGRFLAGASRGKDGQIWLADLTGKTEAALTVPRKYSFNSLAFAPAGHVLCAGCDDGVLALCNLDKPGGEWLEVQWLRGTLLGLALSPDGKWLATGDNYGAVRLWPYPALRAL